MGFKMTEIRQGIKLILENIKWLVVGFIAILIAVITLQGTRERLKRKQLERKIEKIKINQDIETIKEKKTKEREDIIADDKRLGDLTNEVKKLKEEIRTNADNITEAGNREDNIKEIKRRLSNGR